MFSQCQLRQGGLKKREYDPEMAKQLLTKQAGHWQTVKGGERRTVSL